MSWESEYVGRRLPAVLLDPMNMDSALISTFLDFSPFSDQRFIE